MKSFTYWHVVLAVTITLLGGVGIGYFIGYDIGWERSMRAPVQSGPSDLSITNFAECVAAGYPVMESNPRQCNTPDGRNFVEKIVSPTSPGPVTPKPQCVRAGCSSQLCVEADKANDMVTTCEFRAEYACYHTARCERQTTGACGWTATAALTACLANPPGE